jgi:hypothetical protein
MGVLLCQPLASSLQGFQVLEHMFKIIGKRVRSPHGHRHCKAHQSLKVPLLESAQPLLQGEKAAAAAATLSRVRKPA